MDFSAVVQDEAFAVRIETDDLADLVGDAAALDELATLLDRHLVLHLCPQAEIRPESFGRLAVHLGMPTDRERPAGAPPPLSTEFPFIADFTTAGRPASAPRPARPPAYIQSLHYDGISTCSMQATFDTVDSERNRWADMRAAYRSLPDDLKAVVDTRRALHGHIPHQGTPLSDFPPLDVERAKRRPLRIRHPRTGEALLHLPRNPASTIEGLPDDEGVEILLDLWERVETSPASYAAHAGHNQMFVWDGLGTTHTNPPYPRQHPRRLWFVIVPAPDPTVHAWP